MDDCSDDGDESVEDTMKEPAAKRMKRTRTGKPMVMEVETERIKESLRGLNVDQDESDDDSTTHGEIDLEAASADARDSKRLEMSSAKKVKERARRGKMADSVRSLRMLVPGCLDEKKVNQAQVLANSVSYIATIQAQVSSLQKELEQLKAQIRSGNSSSPFESPSEPTTVSFSSRAGHNNTANRSRATVNSKTADISTSLHGAPASIPSRGKTSANPVIKLTMAADSARGQRQFRQSPIKISSTSPGASPTTSPNSSVAYNPMGFQFHNQDTASMAHTTMTDDADMIVPFMPFYGTSSRTSSQTGNRRVGTAIGSTSSPHSSTVQSGTAGFVPHFQPSTNADSGIYYPNAFESSLRSGPASSSGIQSGSPTVSSASFPAHFESTSDPAQSDINVFSSSQLMSLDDIEDVGRWPLYHNHDTAAPSSSQDAMLPYEWTMDDTPSVSVPHLSTDHTHSFPIPNNSAGDPSGSGVCECGKRPIF